MLSFACVLCKRMSSGLQLLNFSAHVARRPQRNHRRAVLDGSRARSSRAPGFFSPHSPRLGLARALSQPSCALSLNLTPYRLNCCTSTSPSYCLLHTGLPQACASCLRPKHTHSPSLPPWSRDFVQRAAQTLSVVARIPVLCGDDEVRSTRGRRWNATQGRRCEPHALERGAVMPA
ncbi:hypothetical protein BD626DRAFT_489063 [Schizophyllum amplum]|uniref:Uncharacterized protein n=1 Tax=Schizophyllum amplum TaxID=97359 RepID=A0A550CL64_9AGAR|nr:hypothetical protein BD626DRAFT_489063 [Auriculariopsis ampla]